MRKFLGQLASESLVYGLSSGLSAFLNVLLVPIYTRVFAPAEYGEMSLVVATMTLASILVVLSLDSAAHRWFWDTGDTADRKATLASWVWFQLALSLVLAGSIFAGSEQLSRMVIGRSGGAPYFRLVALSIPLNVLVVVATNWLRMQRRPWATAGFSLGVVLLTVALTILFVLVLRKGIEGVFLAQILAFAAGTAVACLLMGDWAHPRHFRSMRLRDMMQYALPLLPAALASWVVNAVDRYFVQWYMSAGQVGLYQVGCSLAAVVGLATSAFQQAWAPFAFSIQKEVEARQVYASVLLLYIWSASLAATAVAMLSPEILRVFTTEPYFGAGSVVPFLAFGYVMIGLGYIAALGPSLARRTSPVGAAVGIAALLNLVLNYLLVPRLGKEGAALATLVSQSLWPVYLFRRSQRLYPIPYRFREAFAIVAFAWGLIGVSSILRMNPSAAAVAVKIMLLLLFVPLLFVLRIVTPAQMLTLLRRDTTAAAEKE